MDTTFRNCVIALALVLTAFVGVCYATASHMFTDYEWRSTQAADGRCLEGYAPTSVSPDDTAEYFLTNPGSYTPRVACS